jgi:hypothetical protein
MTVLGKSVTGILEFKLGSNHIKLKLVSMFNAAYAQEINKKHTEYYNVTASDI